MLFGIGWVMLGAFFLGTFALPSKYIKNYAWENTWGAFFFIGMLIVPVGISTLVVNGLWATYADVPPKVIAGVMALGFVWGCGFCLWGYGLALVGLSLGYALNMGTMALVGSMLPFFMGSAEKAATPGGMTVIAGILVCIVGVAVNGAAGMKREKSQNIVATDGNSGGNNMLTGLLVCVAAGVLSSGCNIAFHIGGNIGNISQISADKFGNAPWLVGLSVWTLIFLGGLISSFGFSVILLFKNKSWGGFLNKGSGRNLFYATLMALGHFACLFFYGVGSWKLGVLGTSVGFAIFQSGSLLIGNGLGFLTGEWKGASGESKRYLVSGLSVLILGIIIVSIGNAISS